MKSEHLKNIDVICLDDRNGSVQQRYAEFITFNYYNFKEMNITNYLAEPPGGRKITRKEKTNHGDVVLAEFTDLENQHERMMGRT